MPTLTLASSPSPWEGAGTALPSLLDQGWERRSQDFGRLRGLLQEGVSRP